MASGKDAGRARRARCYIMRHAVGGAWQMRKCGQRALFDEESSFVLHRDLSRFVMHGRRWSARRSKAKSDRKEEGVKKSLTFIRWRRHGRRRPCPAVCVPLTASRLLRSIARSEAVHSIRPLAARSLMTRRSHASHPASRLELRRGGDVGGDGGRRTGTLTPCPNLGI